MNFRQILRRKFGAPCGTKPRKTIYRNLKKGRATARPFLLNFTEFVAFNSSY